MAINSSDLISNAELVSTLTSDAVVSVSTGVGQPQKNIKLGNLATVVSELMGAYTRFRAVTQNNIYSIEVDLNGLGWDNGLPKKWELYGGLWNQTLICYASGVCRLYGSGFDTTSIVSKTGFEPTVSITDGGYLHIDFGTHLSYARLYVYYDI